MASVITKPASPVRARVSPQEWQARVDLAAAYRLVAHYGWDDLIFTHLSARVPDTEHFLINPYGVMFSQISASSLVKIDTDGNALEPRDGVVNAAGFTIHSAVHMARQDATCVMHVHTVAGTAVASRKGGLLPLNQTAMIIYDDVAYHDYEGIAFNLDERPRLVADLGSKNLMLLRNHGTLALGSTVGEAFLRLYHLERACQMQVATLAGTSEPIMPSQAIQDVVRAQARQAERFVTGLAWSACLRLLDEKDDSFRS